MKQTGIACIFLIQVLSSCAQTARKTDHGKIKGTTYIDTYYGVTLEIPENWYYLSKIADTKIAKRNTLIKAGANPILSQYADSTRLCLLNLFKYQPDTLVEDFPEIDIEVQIITAFPELKNIEYAISIMQNKVEGDSDECFTVIPDRQFDKINFKGYHLTVSNDEYTGNSDNYLANFGDYNLIISLHYIHERVKKELDDILTSLKIK